MRANVRLRRSDRGPGKAVMTSVKLPFRDPRFEFAVLPFEIRNSQFEIGEFPVRNACIMYNETRR